MTTLTGRFIVHWRHKSLCADIIVKAKDDTDEDTVEYKDETDRDTVEDKTMGEIFVCEKIKDDMEETIKDIIDKSSSWHPQNQIIKNLCLKTF